MLETKQLMDPIDFHSIFFSYYGSQWGPSNVWLPTCFKISSFVLNRRKKLLQVLEQLEGEKMLTEFVFLDELTL